MKVGGLLILEEVQNGEKCQIWWSRQFLGPRSSNMTLPVPSTRQASQHRSPNSDKSPGYSQRRDLSSSDLRGVHSSKIICSTLTLSSNLGNQRVFFCLKVESHPCHLSVKPQIVHTTEVQYLSTISTPSLDLSARGFLFVHGLKLHSHRPSVEPRV